MKKYSKAFMELQGFKTQEEAELEMSRRGKLGKGKSKKYNKLRDEPGYAKELRSRGIKDGQEEESRP